VQQVHNNNAPSSLKRGIGTPKPAAWLFAIWLLVTLSFGAETHAQDSGEDTQPGVQWSETQRIAALETCLKHLSAANVEIEIAKPVRNGRCGSASVVNLVAIRGDAPVRFRPPVLLNCKMIKAVHDWIRYDVQPASAATLGTTIARIEGGGGYACRNRNGAKTGRLSEHALANALDLPVFRTRDGRRVTVLNGWGPVMRDLMAKPSQSGAAPTTAGRTGATRRAKRTTGETGTKRRTTPAGRPVTPDRIGRRATTAGARDASALVDFDLPDRNPLRTRKGRLSATTSNPSAPANPVATTRREIRKTRLEERSARAASPAKRRGRAGPRPLATKKRRFLRSIHKAACNRFGTVLGPEANDAHRDHFHLDLAPRRRSAYCR